MFKILATICFLSIGEQSQTLCFKSEVPVDFENLEICIENRDKIINYMNQDLIEREAAILFKCTPLNEISL